MITKNAFFIVLFYLFFNSFLCINDQPAFVNVQDNVHPALQFLKLSH
jgi:hypothetical protein